MASTTTSRRASAKADNTTLSREAIIDRALALADREGLDAVSIRRIAQDLGVTPMALYWHVKNKEELLAAMGEEMLSVLTLPADDSPRDIDQLRELMVRLVATLSAHPGSTELAMMQILQCESGQLAAERALDILRRAGFSIEQSANLARTCLQNAIMLVSARPGAETSTPQDERAALLAHKRSALAGLSADRFPHLIESADAFTHCDDEMTYYQGGIELFIGGVQALQRRLQVAAD